MFRSKPCVAAAMTAAVALYASHAIADETDIDQVVTTAAPFAHNADSFATIVGQVSRDQILRSGGANLADVLGEVPGVTGSSFASGASRPVIRGFDANRVRVLENGVGSFDVSDVGPDHGVPIDPLSAQKVEVVRGAATLRYGSQAIGGVVNAINNRVPLEMPGKPITGEISGSTGTAANSRQGSAMVDTKAGPFAFHADGFIRHTGDYGTPLGPQTNSFFRGNGASFGSSYFFGDSRLGAAVVHYDAKYGIPAGDTFIDMRQTKGLFGSSFAVDAGALTTLNIDGGYADYKHSEKDPAAGNAILSTFIDKEWDSRAEALFSVLGPFSDTALGVQVTRKDFSALGEGADYLLPTTTKSFAGFAFTEVPLLANLHLELGGRVEHVDIDGTPVSNIAVSRGFTPVSGSAGLVYESSAALKFGLTLASAARAPGQTELFARGPHDGPATFETGDPTLKMERANSIEGTVRVRTSRVEFEGAAWGAKFNNYIFGRLTGNTCDEDGACASGGGDLKELLFEQRDAAFWGLEGKATITIAETSAGAVGGLVLADYVRATLDGAGNVPRIPPYHVGGGLAWNSPKFDASFLLKYAGAQNNVAFAETPTKGFASLDAQMAWRPLERNPLIELSLVARNLTDRVQRNAVALNKDDVVLQGRDVRVVVRAAF
ncbi:MAG: TonB-dependent receptor [Rhodospirillaceae bacterium]|nr:TonB-dependent receptor [Rhodospirillaceae bacterium]